MSSVSLAERLEMGFRLVLPMLEGIESLVCVDFRSFFCIALEKINDDISERMGITRRDYIIQRLCVSIQAARIIERPSVATQNQPLNPQFANTAEFQRSVTAYTWQTGELAGLRSGVWKEHTVEERSANALRR